MRGMDPIAIDSPASATTPTSAPAAAPTPAAAPAQRPSVGRIVHFHTSPSDPPEAAIVIAVFSDVCINVSKCDARGQWSSQTCLLLEGELPMHPNAPFWRWPPRA